MRTCTACHQLKPLEKFPPDKRAADGRQSRCHACRAAAQRGYAASPDGLAQTAAYRARPEVQDRGRAAKRAAYLQSVGGQLQRQPATTERRRAQRRALYQANLEYYRAKNAAWVRANPVANRLRRARRRARLANAEGTFTANEWRALLALYGGRCLACGAIEQIEPDHVIPLARGGTNWITNIQPLCRSCNSSKRDRTIDYRPTGRLRRTRQRRPVEEVPLF